MKSITILLTLFLLNLTTCTEQQLSESRVAEILYIDLIQSLHHDDIPAAIAAETDLGLQLDKLRPLWQRPMSRTAIDKCRSHLDEAEAAFADIKPALLKNNKEAAIIQLDRVMNELSAADHISFEKIYVGKMYDFYSTWREVHTIINDQMLCLMEWKEYVWWANLAQTEWEKTDCVVPNQKIYRWDDKQRNDFLQARADLGEKLTAFSRKIARGDQCISQEAANAVEASLWKFMLTLKGDRVDQSLLN